MSINSNKEHTDAQRRKLDSLEQLKKTESNEVSCNESFNDSLR
jgi:hypothetical protein